MPHYKRGRRKDARAGCLLCKPHKATGAKGTKGAQPIAELKVREAEAHEEDDGEAVTGVICRAFRVCPNPELCQERCDLLDWVKYDEGG